MPRQVKKPKTNTPKETADTGPAQAAKAPKRRRGRLQDMLGMPLDVVFEILAYVEPLDLLHLARTNKQFRGMLMARRNVVLWKAAWRNVEGLPECPDGVAHPAVAAVVFCSKCHKCGRANSKWIFWDRWERYCQRCQKAIFGMENYSYWGRYHPQTSIGDALAIELPPAIRELKCYELCATRVDPVYRTSPEDGCVLTECVDELKAKLTDMSMDARSAYLAERKALLGRWRESATAFNAWFAVKRVDRYSEMIHLKKSRHESILEQLKKEGWYAEYMLLSDMGKAIFQALPAVRQARALTERSWRNIAPTIIGRLEKAKELRLLEEQGERLRTRFATFIEALPTLYIYRPGEPSDIDIATGVPELRQIIDSPASQQVDATSFNFLRDDGILAAFAERWKKDCKTAIAKRIAQAVPNMEPDTDPHSLAMAAGFTCRRCVVDAPCDPLAHRCDYEIPGWGPEARSRDLYSQVAPHSSLTAHFWNPHTFFHETNLLSAVITKCGFDPARATIDELNASPVRLGCSTCIREAPGIAVMTWFAAYRHFGFSAGHRRSKYPWHAVVVNEAMTAAVREAEEECIDAIRAESEADTRRVHCSRCPQGHVWSGEKREFARHLEMLHDDGDKNDYWCASQTTRSPKYRDAFVYLLSREHENSPNTGIISREKHAPLVFMDALDADDDDDDDDDAEP